MLAMACRVGNAVELGRSRKLEERGKRRAEFGSRRQLVISHLVWPCASGLACKAIFAPHRLPLLLLPLLLVSNRGKNVGHSVTLL